MLPRKSAKIAQLALVISIPTSCARDPNIAIPTATRHSMDSQVDSKYQSIDEGEDTLIAGHVNDDAPAPIDIPEPEVSPANPDYPTGEVIADAPDENPTNEVTTPKPEPVKPTPEPVKPTPEPVKPTPEPEVTGLIADGKYIVQGVGSKKCMDVPGGSTTNGAQLQIWTCQDANPNQLLTIQWVKEQKAYKILSSGGKQFIVAKDNTTASSPLILGDSTTSAHGLWIIEKAGNDSTYRLRLKDKQLVWDVLSAGTADATKMIVFSIWEPAQSQQQWLFVKAK